MNAACLLWLAFLSGADAARHWDFEKAPVGKVPDGWTATHTYEGAGSVWRVLDDPTAPDGAHVLAQTSDAGPDKFFNLCVADDTSYADVDLAVSFKAVAGKFDRGGGLVWRYQDADNYYLARMNPLEDNFRVYKVEKGVRTQFQSADAKVPSGEWHRLRVVQRGDHIVCLLDDKPLLDVHDKTFAEAGKIGLWSKADAITSFDNLTVAEPKD